MKDADPFPFVKRAFETIALAKVAFRIVDDNSDTWNAFMAFIRELPADVLNGIRAAKVGEYEVYLQGAFQRLAKSLNTDSKRVGQPASQLE